MNARLGRAFLRREPDGGEKDGASRFPRADISRNPLRYAGAAQRTFAGFARQKTDGLTIAWKRKDMYTFLDMLRKYMPMLLPALVLGAAAYFLVLCILKRRGRRLSAAWNVWLFVSASYLFAMLFVLVLRGGESRGRQSANFELFYGYRMLAKSYSAHAFTGELMNILIFLPFGFLFALPLERAGSASLS